MYPQNPGNLPVSPTQVDPSAWVQQGLPMQPPFVPQLNLPPPLQGVLPQIVGYSMLELQQNAQRNPLRTFAYNLYSRNRYQNEDFQAFLGTVIEFVTFLMMTQGMQPQQAIPTAAAEVNNMLMAVQVSRFPALEQFIPNPQTAQEIRTIQDQFRALAEQIRAFKARAAAPSPQGGWNHNPSGGTGWGAPGWNQGGNPQWGGGGGMMSPMSGGFQPTPGMHNHGAPMPAGPRYHGDIWQTNHGNVGHGSGEPMGRFLKPRGGGTGAVVEELTMAPGQETKFKQFENAAHRQANTNTEEPQFKPWVGVTQPVESHKPSHVSIGDSEWPKVHNEPGKVYDSVLFENGYEQRPAFKSGWKPSFMPEQPYPKLYDPTTHMLFHLRHPDGTVTERVLKKTDDMNYLEHELDARLREQHKASLPNQPKVAYDWALVQKLKPLPGQPLAVPPKEFDEEEESQDVDATPTPISANSVMQVHNVAEADMRVNFILPEADEYRKSQTPFEYYFDVVTPYNTDANLINTVRTLGNQTTMEDFRTQLISLHSQQQLPEEVYRVINERATARLNEALKMNMGITSWKIDSFVEDYPDLITSLQNDYGKVVTEALIRHGEDVITYAASVLSNDSFAKYLRSIAGGEEIDPKQASKLLVFRERCSTTRVPWKMDHLLSVLNLDTGSMVPESSFPNMHKALAAIYERTSDPSIPFARRFLMTEDSVLLEVREGYLGEDCYLLARHA